jgi:hypothetical protein
MILLRFFITAGIEKANKIMHLEKSNTYLQVFSWAGSFSTDRARLSRGKHTKKKISASIFQGWKMNKRLLSRVCDQQVERLFLRGDKVTKTILSRDSEKEFPECKEVHFWIVQVSRFFSHKMAD